MLLAMNARQRVASFLLEMAARLGQPDILTLPMSRQHIADYLGLTIETVSRVLTQFEGAYLIGSRSSRHMILLDQPALRQLIDGRDSAISSRTCETAQARAGAAHLA